MSEQSKKELQAIENDILIATELHYPNIVLELLRDELDTNKRQRILHNARIGLYDDTVFSSKDAARMKHTKEQTMYCQDCIFFVSDKNTSEGYCNHPNKKKVIRKWGCRTACKKLFIAK